NRKKASRSAASSALGGPLLMKGKSMKKGASERLTPKQRTERKSLAALRYDAIDTSDAPELLDWSGAKPGPFYRPVKQQLTLRLDSDVVAWFKSHTTASEGYQTRINQALREYVRGQASRTRRSRAKPYTLVMQKGDRGIARQLVARSECLREHTVNVAPR